MVWKKLRLISLASSMIIDHMRKSGSASLAFFYCDFRDDKKKHRRGLLSSLLVQLCNQSIDYAKILQTFYLGHRDGLEEPSEFALTQCLKSILRCAGDHPIYIILDALDECPKAVGTPSPREKVLELVKELVDCQLPSLRICVTSRPEIDIETVLDQLKTHSVSLHDETGQRKDIEEYIKSAVGEMGNVNEQDKELVIQTLSRKANGM
jgi:NACHT domain